MERIFDILIYRLFNKGLAPGDIPEFIRDVLDILNDGGQFTADMINLMLENLGWSGRIMDEYTFDLILQFLERNGVYEVRPHTIH